MVVLGTHIFLSYWEDINIWLPMLINNISWWNSLFFPFQLPVSAANWIPSGWWKIGQQCPGFLKIFFPERHLLQRLTKCTMEKFRLLKNGIRSSSSPCPSQALCNTKGLFGTQISGNQFISSSVHREMHWPQADLLKLFFHSKPTLEWKKT